MNSSTQLHTGYPLISESFDWSCFDPMVDHVLLFNSFEKFKPKKLEDGGYVLFAQKDIILNESRTFVPCHTDIIFRHYRRFYITFPLPGTESFEKCVQQCFFYDSFVERTSGVVIYCKKSRINDSIEIKAGEPIARIGFGKRFNPLDAISNQFKNGGDFYKSLPEAIYEPIPSYKLSTPLIVLNCNDNTDKRMNRLAINMGLMCKDMKFQPKQIGPGDYIFMAQKVQVKLPSGHQKVYLGQFKFSSEEPMLLMYPLYGSTLSHFFKIITFKVNAGQIISEVELENSDKEKQGLCIPGTPVARLVSFWRERVDGPSQEFLSKFLRHGNQVINLLPDAHFSKLMD